MLTVTKGVTFTTWFPEIWIKWKLKDFQIIWANILFTLEHRYHNKCLQWKSFKIVCTKLAHLKFDACYRSQNSWGWACLPWFSISSSFQNSLKTTGLQGYEFRCWNLAQFLPDIGFQLLKSLWLSLMYFSFNDAPNALHRWKIWTAGRQIQHSDSSTTKPRCCNSYNMWLCIVLLK